MNRLQLLKEKLYQKIDQKQINKLQWFKPNGWGYKDTEFVLDSDGQIKLTGTRYKFSGQKMPKFKEFIQNVVGLKLSNPIQPQKHFSIDSPILNNQFMAEIKGKIQQITTEEECRIMHSHGQAIQEIFQLVIQGKLQRFVDVVVFVNNTQQVQFLVQAAKKYPVVLIPFGGGTNVSHALTCVKSENKSIISVDMTRMNKIKWIDKKNMCACVEAGIIGKDMQKQLQKYGVICGHQPDSIEFSSLGGWISTRASGMKKNKYGNIEDILLNVKIVTPIGTFTKNQITPRLSSGPNINQLVLGHQGILGIITQAVIKLQNIPQVREYDSIIFHNFQHGINFMYEVGMSKIWPASLRTVDNKQFQLGLALKTQSKGKYKEIVDKAKKYFVTEYMKFDPQKMCLSTIVFEGSKQEVNLQQRNVYAIAKKYKGYRAGSQNGQRGYFLTYMIAYLRDFAFKYDFIGESFQTSICWKDVNKMCKAVQACIISSCKHFGINKQPFISFRVTQVYDTGAAVYIYFAFIYTGISDPIAVYSQIQDKARQQILKNGGSISHHHGKYDLLGVGKLRKKFLGQSIGNTGINILKKLKESIDPTNIFGSGNLIG